jgi:hypothetical protein
MVRLLVSSSTTATTPGDLGAAVSQQLAGLLVDDGSVAVELEILGKAAAAAGSTLVVDGAAAVLAAGAAGGEKGAPSSAVGFEVAGEVAMAQLADFDRAWKLGQPWRCRPDAADGAGCLGAAPTRVTYHLPDPSVDQPANCGTMLFVARSPVKRGSNPSTTAADDTQDQAILALLDGASQRVRIVATHLVDPRIQQAIARAATRGVVVELALAKGDPSVDPGARANEAAIRSIHQALYAAGVGNACNWLRTRWFSEDGEHPQLIRAPLQQGAAYLSVDDRVVLAGTLTLEALPSIEVRENSVLVDDPATVVAWDGDHFSAIYASGAPVELCRE